MSISSDDDNFDLMAVAPKAMGKANTVQATGSKKEDVPQKMPEQVFEFKDDKESYNAKSQIQDCATLEKQIINELIALKNDKQIKEGGIEMLEVQKKYFINQ